MYQDNELKFVAVLNVRIAVPQLMNALGHMAAGLVSSQDGRDFSWLCYVDADGGIHPAISRFPFIILAAKNSSQIRALRRAAIAAGIAYNDFVDRMLGCSAEEQLASVHAAGEAELEYLGVCLFGPGERLNPLTRRFSLFKS